MRSLLHRRTIWMALIMVLMMEGSCQTAWSQPKIARIYLFKDDSGSKARVERDLNPKTDNRPFDLSFFPSDSRTIALKDFSMFSTGKESVKWNAYETVHNRITSPLDLTNNATRFALLDRLRGQTVELRLIPKGVEAGKLIAVESREVNKKTIIDLVLAPTRNAAHDSVKVITLTDIESIGLANGRILDEASFLGRVENAKKFHFEAQSEGPATFRYLLPIPAFTITLDLEASEKSTRGWVEFENNTFEDWNDVEFYFSTDATIMEKNSLSKDDKSKIINLGKRSLAKGSKTRLGFPTRWGEILKSTWTYKAKEGKVFQKIEFSGKQAFPASNLRVFAKGALIGEIADFELPSPPEMTSVEIEDKRIKVEAKASPTVPYKFFTLANGILEYQEARKIVYKIKNGGGAATTEGIVLEPNTESEWDPIGLPKLPVIGAGSQGLCVMEIKKTPTKVDLFVASAAILGGLANASDPGTSDIKERLEEIKNKRAELDATVSRAEKEINATNQGIAAIADKHDVSEVPEMSNRISVLSLVDDAKLTSLRTQRARAISSINNANRQYYDFVISRTGKRTE